MKKVLLFAGIACLSLPVQADSYLIENVRIFNGVDARLTPGHVLVEDGIISKVSGDPIDLPDGAVVLDGDNRVLTPGFIDLHVHLTSHVPSSTLHSPGENNEKCPAVCGYRLPVTTRAGR